MNIEEWDDDDPWQERDEDEDWKHMVRPTDPSTSHDAASEVEVSKDENVAYNWANLLNRPSGFTAAEFRDYVERNLITAGWTHQQAQRRAESLRRRLSGLLRKGKLVYHWEDLPNGKRRPERRDKQQIYFFP